MTETNPGPNAVNLSALLMEGARTVEITVRGHAISVSMKLEEDPTVDKETGRARMSAQRAIRAANALAAVDENAPERESLEAELAQATDAMDALDSALIFDRRRIACRRIAGNFTGWSLLNGDAPVPLDFDGLYDGPIPTPLLEEIYEAARTAE